jgi:hypothetical protein
LVADAKPRAERAKVRAARNFIMLCNLVLGRRDKIFCEEKIDLVPVAYNHFIFILVVVWGQDD